MIKLEKLKGHHQANAHLKIDKRYTELWSYSTRVLIHDRLNGRIECTGLYSATTRRHISWYMEETFNGKYDYYDIKKAYQNNTMLEVM